MAQVPAARVVTPEAVPLEFEPAGLGSRFLALLVDWLIQGALVLGIFFSIAVFANSGGGDGGWVAVTVLLVLLFLVIWGYPTALETLWRGRTVGKAALGLRVVTREGAPVRFRHAAIRATLGVVDFLLTSGAGAVLSVLLTRDNQRLGDLVAGTLVLRERTGLKAPSAVTFAVPPGLEGYAATLDTAALTPSDYATVRSFLLRAPTLPAPVRADLAVRLAGPVAGRLRVAPPPGLPPEAFLACVVAAYQARAGGRPAGPPPPSGWPPPQPVPPASPPPSPAPAPPPPADTGGFVPPA